MTATQLQVVNLRELVKGLRRIGDVEIRQRVRVANRTAAGVVHAGGVVEAPRRSGRLAGAGRPLATQRDGRVKWGSAAVPYAGVIHFGWPRRNIAANPFVIRAWEARTDQVVDVYETEIRWVLRRAAARGVIA